MGLQVERGHYSPTPNLSYEEERTAWGKGVQRDTQASKSCFLKKKALCCALLDLKFPSVPPSSDISSAHAQTPQHLVHITVTCDNPLPRFLETLPLQNHHRCNHIYYSTYAVQLYLLCTGE